MMAMCFRLIAAWLAAAALVGCQGPEGFTGDPDAGDTSGTAGAGADDAADLADEPDAAIETDATLEAEVARDGAGGDEMDGAHGQDAADAGSDVAPPLDAGTGGVDGDAAGAVDARDAADGRDVADVTETHDAEDAHGPTIRLDVGSATAVPPFSADNFFHDGSPETPSTAAVDRSAVADPAPEAVYQTARIGGFSYTVPGFPANAPRTIRLHFCETYFPAPGTTAGVDQRLCTVSINGQVVLPSYDIFAKAGAKNKATVEQFVLPASAAGTYVLEFVPAKDQCLLAGIEIL